MNQTALSNLIWSVADHLRGDYKQSEFGKVILPFTVLRRLDCALEPYKAGLLEEVKQYEDLGVTSDKYLTAYKELNFYNKSRFDLKILLDDKEHIRENFKVYLESFSGEVRDIIKKFDFYTQLDRLKGTGLLYLVTQCFAAFDLHPDKVSNTQMGLVFEELIRKFAESSNETAGEHFTPREVIKLMVNLLFLEKNKTPELVSNIYDPTAGTGGMLSVACEHLEKLKDNETQLSVYGQELNPESYAICKADMLIKGQEVENIKFGNIFTEDGLSDEKFGYMLSNPPFGVDWKKVERTIRDEQENRGYNGRFGPGLPRVSDGSLLFLLHLLSKMRSVEEGGSRIAIVLNGSPLFTGGAGSGESEIRRYLLENDLLEAIIGLPTDMFYNTGISTYVWIVTNRKPQHRKGKVQLIDASRYFQKMRKSLGSKRKELGSEHIETITRLFESFTPESEGDKPISRILDNQDFGYHTITVERPLRLKFQVTETALDMLKTQIEKIGTAKIKADNEALHRLLQDFDPERIYLSAQQFHAEIQKAAKQHQIRLNAAQFKTIVHFTSSKDPAAEPVLNAKKQPIPDPELRDTENVPLKEDINIWFQREVIPHVPDAWIDHDKTKVGYEIPFNRHFYVFEAPRTLPEIDADLKQCTDRIKAMIEGLSA